MKKEGLVQAVKKDFVKKGIKPEWIHDENGCDIKLYIPNTKGIGYQIITAASKEKIPICLKENDEPGWYVTTTADIILFFYTPSKYYKIRYDDLTQWATTNYDLLERNKSDSRTLYLLKVKTTSKDLEYVGETFRYVERKFKVMECEL